MFLEGYRFTPPEALEAGLVDHIVSGDTEAVLAKAEELASSLEHLPQLGGYGLIKVFAFYLLAGRSVVLRFLGSVSCTGTSWRESTEMLF